MNKQTLLNKHGFENRTAEYINQKFNPLAHSASIADLMDVFSLAAPKDLHAYNTILKTHAEYGEHLTFITADNDYHTHNSSNIYHAVMSKNMVIRCAAALGLNAESIDALNAKFELLAEQEEKERAKIKAPILNMINAPKNGTWVLLFSNEGTADAPLYCEVCRYDAHNKKWIDGNGVRFAGGRAKPIGWCVLPDEYELTSKPTFLDDAIGSR